MQQLTSGVDMQAGNQTKSEAKELAARSEDDMATFDPNEELRQGQIAERERRKAITTTPAGAPAVPRMKVCNPNIALEWISLSTDRSKNRLDWRDLGINFLHCCTRRTRIARHSRRGSRKAKGTARRLVPNTVGLAIL